MQNTTAVATARERLHGHRRSVVVVCPDVMADFPLLLQQDVEDAARVTTTAETSLRPY
jgi:hypothetical protein